MIKLIKLEKTYHEEVTGNRYFYTHKTECGVYCYPDCDIDKGNAYWFDGEQIYHEEFITRKRQLIIDKL